jgi:hypothetical protein
MSLTILHCFLGLPLSLRRLNLIFLNKLHQLHIIPLQLRLALLYRRLLPRLLMIQLLNLLLDRVEAELHEKHLLLLIHELLDVLRAHLLLPGEGDA